ncbi:MAG TPA: hypothetical protein VIL48_20430 [Acidimicrobiales bacterium]
MGQLTDPYSQGEDDEIGIVLSGLPGEPLEPEPGGLEGGADAPEDAHDELVFELETWSDIERDAVTDRLREAGIPHWWVDTALHVADADREAVEAVLDAVEGSVDDGGEGDDDDVEVVTLDPDRDQVAYDVSEWDDDRVAALTDLLDEADIDWGWDGDELFVYADDEEKVDELVDKAAHPHELPAEPDEGESGAEILGELFVAADRLRTDPEDHEAWRRLLDMSEAAEDSDPPYGLDARDWDHLRERVTALTDLLDEDLDAMDTQAVMAAASGLRTSLRPFV